MVKPIPSLFNPDLLARDSSPYSVTLPLAQFTRLQELLLNDTGEMNATFRFSHSRDKVAGKDTVVVSGHLNTCYQLQCQRCLEPMEFGVENEAFEFVFARNEQVARDMPEELDPVVLDDSGQIHIVDLFEDELILHLPTVPRHEQVELCEQSEHLLSKQDLQNQQDLNESAETNGSADSLAEQSNKKKNPFDVLKDLDLHS